MKDWETEDTTDAYTMPTEYQMARRPESINDIRAFVQAFWDAEGGFSFWAYDNAVRGKLDANLILRRVKSDSA
jgi:hypothetical protein